MEAVKSVEKYKDRVQQEPMPFTKVRSCAKCGGLISFFDFIHVQARLNKVTGSFILKQLIELWSRFKNMEEKLICEGCVIFYL